MSEDSFDSLTYDNRPTGRALSRGIWSTRRAES